jgi:predicted Na+-dependent transporter
VLLPVLLITSNDYAAAGPAASTFVDLRPHMSTAWLPHAAEIAYGLLSILLITPLLGLLVAQLPLNPRPLALGLALVCTMPTALACGVAFVQVS